MSSTSLFTWRRPKPRITNASIARTKAMPTSSAPHHLGQDSLSLTKAATKGNAVEMQNTIAAVTARERIKHARWRVVRGGGCGVGGALWLVSSDAIGFPSIKRELSASRLDLKLSAVKSVSRKVTV